MVNKSLNEATKPAEKTRVLHLCGSPTSTFYFDLSVLYARTCTEFEGLDREAFEHSCVIVFTNGKWGFPENMTDSGIKAAEASAVGMGAALARLEAMSPALDVVVPHMFCLAGMTQYRGLVEVLGVELLGCSAQTCAVGQDKFLTKAICQAEGVPVPRGDLLRKDAHGQDTAATAKKLLESWSAPLIVKPAREDNSIGLSLVKQGTPEALQAALDKAFQYDDYVLLEEYIAGREVRVALLEVGEGEDVRYEILPKLEYVLEDIREQKHKLGTDASGKLLTGDGKVDEAFQKAKEEGERICPAQLAPEVHQRLDDLAKRAHKALNCKYYSLYDVRINKEGFPFMLESCLFCSFSPYSVIVGLAAKTEGSELQPHPKVFELLLKRAANETRARREEAAAGAAGDGAGGVKRRKTAA